MFGGIFSIITYIIKLTNFQNLVLKIIISILIVKISYKPTKIKYLIRSLMFFYFVSLAFGGSAFMLLYFVSPESVLSKDGVLIGTYPLRVTLVGAGLAFVLTRNSFKNYKRQIKQKRNAM